MMIEIEKEAKELLDGVELEEPDTGRRREAWQAPAEEDGLEQAENEAKDLIMGIEAED